MNDNNNVISTEHRIRDLIANGAVTITGPKPTHIKTADDGTRNCFVCGQTTVDMVPLIKKSTTHMKTSFLTKIAEILGNSFKVTVSMMDVVCESCTLVINYLDRLEYDVEHVRDNIMDRFNRNYDFYGENDGAGGVPAKQRKMNNTTAKPTSHSQKLARETTVVEIGSTADAQLRKHMMSKVFKCTMCTFKTTDMMMFNIHYESCEQRRFHCRLCKKIHPNFGELKQHIMQKHHILVEHRCGICHIHFSSVRGLLHHMKLHLCADETVRRACSDATSIHPTVTALWCPHCQFVSTNKVVFDEHLQRHSTEQRQPYYKCGTCHTRFLQLDKLIKHFQLHQRGAHNIFVEKSASRNSHTSHTTASAELTAQNIVSAANSAATNPFFRHNHVEVHHRNNHGHSMVYMSSPNRTTIDQASTSANTVAESTASYELYGDELIITPFSVPEIPTSNTISLDQPVVANNNNISTSMAAPTGQCSNHEDYKAVVAVGHQPLPMDVGPEANKMFVITGDGEVLPLDDQQMSQLTGKQLVLQDTEQIQVALESIVLQSGNRLDANTVQMLVQRNLTLVMIQCERKNEKPIDSSCLNPGEQRTQQCDEEEIDVALTEDVIVEVTTTSHDRTLMQEPAVHTSAEDSEATAATFAGVSNASNTVDSAEASEFLNERREMTRDNENESLDLLKRLLLKSASV